MPLLPHALTTYEAVKEYLKLSDDTQKSSIERMINAVSEFIEGYCDRHFEKATYTEKYRGNGRQKLLLNQYPVTAVTSVTVNGTTVDPAEYEVLSEEGILYNDGLWPWTGYYVGLIGEPTGSKLGIEVQYTAGYVLPKDDGTGTPPAVRNLPYDLEDACIELVAIRYEMRGSEHMKRETIGPLTSEFIQDIPEHILKVLNKYKKLVVA
ncbi:MAG: phage head-tail connector protein [Bacillota bacterium]